LFAARPVGNSPGTTGAVYFMKTGDKRGANKNLVSDIRYARTVQKRKIILSVGGANYGMSFPNRKKSQTFVKSIVTLYKKLGGFDGLDWNTFEDKQAPDTNEMIWISLELKRRYPGFLITAAPAPWKPVDKKFCQAMVHANAMDYAAPQYYDGPDLAEQSFVVKDIKGWISLLGASHVVVGLGVIPNKKYYMTVDVAIATWKQIRTEYPTIRGAFNWNIVTDEAQGWAFAKNVGPLVTGNK
jgi:chitinase